MRKVFRWLVVGVLFCALSIGAGILGERAGVLPKLSEPTFPEALKAIQEHPSAEGVVGTLLCSIDRLPNSARKQYEGQIAELAMSHWSGSVRLSASEKLTEFRLNKTNVTNFDSDFKAVVEQERSARLREINALLQLGQLEAARARVGEVAYTFEDSHDLVNRITAIDAVRLYAELERASGICANECASVFPKLLRRGLLSTCYPGSIACDLDNLEEPSFWQARIELPALSEALQAFGPEAAEVSLTQFRGAVRRGWREERVPYEDSQCSAVLILLDRQTVPVIDRLLESMAETERLGDHPINAYLVIAKLHQRYPEDVRQALTRSPAKLGKWADKNLKQLVERKSSTGPGC